MSGLRTWGMLALLAAAGCAEDRILPVEARCGDGVVTRPEECDMESPGCAECRVLEGYACDESSCSEVCGDGQVVGGEECDPPDGLSCDQSCREATREGCSMEGWYLMRQTNFSRDTIISAVQTSTLWYVFRFTQTDDTFEVAEYLGCSLRVTGSVTVSLDDASARSLLYSSNQGPAFPQGARRGHSRLVGDRCEFDFERWYLIRGAEDRFLPSDFRSKPALASLPPLPAEADPLNPSPPGPDGAIDPDGDGLPGLAMRLTGNIPGIRSAVQRDWNECVTIDDRPIAPDAVEFLVRSDFDNEERVLSVTECEPASCALLVAGSNPAQDLPGRATFRYLGRDLSEPRVSAVVRGAPGSDADVDMETCALAQAALPLDTTLP